MKSPLARGLVAVAAIAAVVVLFVALAGGDDDDSGNAGTTQTQATTGATGATGATGTEQEQPAEPAQPAVERVVVVDGKPRGGVKRLSYESGDRIVFTVTSDVAEEVHVHGYDISRDVPAGGAVRFSFPARLEGVFEVELHGTKQQIAELRVSPG